MTAPHRTQSSASPITPGGSGGSEQPQRSRNARAQARHRAKRKLYIEQLEETVTKLQAALNLTPEQVQALPPTQVRIRELEQDNSRLRSENDALRLHVEQLTSPGRISSYLPPPLASPPPRRQELEHGQDRALEKKRRRVSDEAQNTFLTSGSTPPHSSGHGASNPAHTRPGLPMLTLPPPISPSSSLMRPSHGAISSVSASTSSQPHGSQWQTYPTGPLSATTPTVSHGAPYNILPVPGTPTSATSTPSSLSASRHTLPLPPVGELTGSQHHLHPRYPTPYNQSNQLRERTASSGSAFGTSQTDYSGRAMHSFRPQHSQVPDGQANSTHAYYGTANSYSNHHQQTYVTPKVEESFPSISSLHQVHAHAPAHPSAHAQHSPNPAGHSPLMHPATSHSHSHSGNGNHANGNLQNIHHSSNHHPFSHTSTPTGQTSSHPAYGSNASSHAFEASHNGQDHWSQHSHSYSSGGGASQAHRPP